MKNIKIGLFNSTCAKESFEDGALSCSQFHLLKLQTAVMLTSGSRTNSGAGRRSHDVPLLLLDVHYGQN